MAGNEQTEFPFGRGDYKDEKDKDYEQVDNYKAILISDDTPCTMTHSYSSHLTHHNPDGTITNDPNNNSNPIPQIDRSKHPILSFRFNRKVGKAANEKAPLAGECVWLAFYDLPRGSQRWGGKLQVICRKAYTGRTSVWLDYNGLSNPNATALDQAANGPARLMFTRNLDLFRRIGRTGNPSDWKYRERIYISVNRCKVTVIGEASLQHKDRRLIRSTKIHEIDCCHHREEDQA